MKIKQVQKAKQIKEKITRKLRWGISGCGNFAENTFLPTFQHLKKSKLISVYSHSLERARFIENKFAAESAFNNFDEFLKSDFDVLYISSINLYHYEQVLKAAEAKKHILCEKPMALTSAQAKEMVDVCNKNNVFLSINYVHRFHPLVVKAKELIEKDMLGKLVSVSIHFNINYAPNDNYRFKKKLSGGGALRDLGPHVIDLLRFFGGEISDIKGYIDNIIYQSEVDDFANAILKYENSGYGYLNVSYNSPKAFNRIDILGFKGCLSINNIIGSKSSPGKLIIDLEGEGRKSFRRRANKLLYRLRNFQKALLKNIEPAITGYDGLINLELMEKLEESCKR